MSDNYCKNCFCDPCECLIERDREPMVPASEAIRYRKRAVDAESQLTAALEAKAEAERKRDSLSALVNLKGITEERMRGQIDTLTAENERMRGLLEEWQDDSCYCVKINGEFKKCLACRTREAIAPTPAKPEEGGDAHVSPT